MSNLERASWIPIASAIDEVLMPTKIQSYDTLRVPLGNTKSEEFRHLFLKFHSHSAVSVRRTSSIFQWKIGDWCLKLQFRKYETVSIPSVTYHWSDVFRSSPFQTVDYSSCAFV